MTLRDSTTDALRYWEPRRVIYNLVLAAIVITYYFISYPASKSVVDVDFVLGLFLLAVGANVCYCAVYLVSASGTTEIPPKLSLLPPVLAAAAAAVQDA